MKPKKKPYRPSKTAFKQARKLLGMPKTGWQTPSANP